MALILPRRGFDCSPGLPRSGYPGNPSKMTMNPNGVPAMWGKHDSPSRRRVWQSGQWAATPLGLIGVGDLRPNVAAERQRWARDEAPLGQNAAKRPANLRLALVPTLGVGTRVPTLCVSN